MPHALSMPAPGLQALILCGPGSSFPTFTANADDNPKALLPIANRPMVWYALEFCYRMGIANITLICPPSSSNAIKTAMRTNPALTTLPLPRPSILSPKDLDYNTGTAEILRLNEVKAAITTNFVVLPCDLVCELPGDKFLQTWMATAAKPPTLASERNGHGSSESGLSVYYETKKNAPVKGEEMDFVMTCAISDSPSAISTSNNTLGPHLQQLIYSMPTDSLRDLMSDQRGLPLRRRLVEVARDGHQKHQQSCVSVRSTLRDAHIYVFPKWIAEFVQANPGMESIGEDVLGWWAKASWQDGLQTQLGLNKILTDDGDDEYEPLSSSSSSPPYPGLEDTTDATATGEESRSSRARSPTVPPMLAYIHPTDPDAPLIRRVDTAQLLLNVSLQLAKLAAMDGHVGGGAPISPFAHAKKVAYPEGIKPRTTITQNDSLVAENVTVEEKSAIKESVVGANCQIKEGAKLTRCVLMDGVVIGKSCRLAGCIIGRRAEIGDGCVLTDVEVQENLLVEPRTEDKGNRLMSSEGLEATEADMDAFGDGDDDSDLV